MPGRGPGPDRAPKSFDPNFGLPSPGEVVKKLFGGKAKKTTVGGRSMAMGSAAPAAPKRAPKKAPKSAKEMYAQTGAVATPDEVRAMKKPKSDSIGKAADRAFKSQARDEAYRKSRAQLGDFYLSASGGYGSDFFSGKKKK